MSTELPLSGIRVLDLTGVWAGSFSTAILADLGAEVLKHENRYIWQPATRAGIARPPREMTQEGNGWLNGYPNNEPGPRPWNYNPMFISFFRNKRAFTADIRRPEGLEILGKLAEICDVAVENSVPGTMEKLGITWEWLKEKNPQMIFLRASGYGLTGKYRETRTFGAHIEGTMGHALLRSYRDESPDTNSSVFAADYIAGTQMAFAIMAALWKRKTSGTGQLIELALSENAVPMFAQAYMNFALNKKEEKRIGNRSIYEEEAPSGIYPCKPVGDGSGHSGGDRWIAISITTDKEWENLKAFMGEPDWMQSEAFKSGAGRAAQHDLLDKQIAEWTVHHDDIELFHKLQKSGIPASPILDGSRITNDPHVLDRDLYQEQELEDPIGVFRYPRPLYLLPASEEKGIRLAPRAMGQDNEYVYRELLNITDEEYLALEQAGHIANEFDESLP